MVVEGVVVAQRGQNVMGRVAEATKAGRAQGVSRLALQLTGVTLADGSQVNVQSLNGVVQLSGFVDSQEAKERAGQIASSTKGVVQVYNNLLTPTGR